MIHLEHIVALQRLHWLSQFIVSAIIFIPGFNSPGKALEKTIKQPWKTLDFWISEDVRTLFHVDLDIRQKLKSRAILYNQRIESLDKKINITSKQSLQIGRKTRKNKSILHAATKPAVLWYKMQ